MTQNKTPTHRPPGTARAKLAAEFLRSYLRNPEIIGAAGFGLIETQRTLAITAIRQAEIFLDELKKWTPSESAEGAE